MIEIFDKPRIKVHSRTVSKLYPNKAYLILNPEQTSRIDTDGVKVITGFSGELYAIADSTPKDKEMIAKEIEKLTKEGYRYGLLDDFPISDCIIY